MCLSIKNHGAKVNVGTIGRLDPGYELILLLRVIIVAWELRFWLSGWLVAWLDCLLSGRCDGLVIVEESFDDDDSRTYWRQSPLPIRGCVTLA